MSKFSGKCDFYDEIEIFGLDRILNAKVYIGDKLLKLSSIKDCIPYYPYIVTCAAYRQNDRDIIRLSNKSWVDMEMDKYGKTFCHDYYKELLRKEMEKYETSD